MKKADLIKVCRYYKGKNTLEYSDNTKNILANYEKAWVEFMTGERDQDVLYTMVDEYLSAELGTFQNMDDIPLGLKAVIFFIFGKYHSGGLMEQAEDFKKFYNDYYKNE